MLNRGLCYLLVLSLFLSLFCLDAYAGDIYISAHSAVVMVAATGQVVYSKNMDEKRGMASTTKIMTSVIALESGLINKTVNAKSDDVNVEGTSLGLKAGDKVTLLALVKGMLLSSGNDSANVTATFLGGDKEGFAHLMNNKAREIGMSSTSFRNPSGLTEEGHYSTAYDMALLGCYAIKNPLFREICSYKSCTVLLGDPQYEKTLYNHNRFLTMYEGAFGIKTGFTKASGRCLVTAVSRGNVTLVAVTLNASDDWNDHKKLYDYCFSTIKLHKLKIPVDSVDVAGSRKAKAKVTFSREIVIPYMDEIPDYSVEVYMPRFLYCPLKKGDFAGYIDLRFNDFFEERYYITTAENIKK